ncbi:MAG: ABC transporter ATP-binding protein [Thermoflexales bacterium]|nr:ABC transporter ATP-binding protein [Thermoflexales bacterium]
MPSHPTLSVRNLAIEYQTRRGWVKAAQAVNFDLLPGEALALIGESGSGKTTVGTSLIRLLPGNATISAGEIVYRRPVADGSATEIDVRALDAEGLRRFRWKEAAMVFQGSMNAFNPVLRISDQFNDTSRAHGGPRGRELVERGKSLLELVRLDPRRVWEAYPHELSGGMRQRVLIALALLLEPQLLILDEPTTALDVLTQRSVIDVLRDLRKALNFSMIFISHDLALAAELVDRMATFYAGTIVEIGNTRTLFNRPHHPYTRGLLRSLPTLDSDRAEVASIPGSPPDLINLPKGCAFHARCQAAQAICSQDMPPPEEVAARHIVRCHFWRDVAGAARAEATR